MRQPDVAGFRWAGGIVVALRTDPEGIVTAAPSILNLTDQASDRMSVGRMHATDAVGYRDAYTAALDWLEFPTLADGVDVVEVVDEQQPLTMTCAQCSRTAAYHVRTVCSEGHDVTTPLCEPHWGTVQSLHRSLALYCSAEIDAVRRCTAVIEAVEASPAGRH